jgi:PEP-CTERM motif
MTTHKGLTLSTCLLAAFWTAGANALLIDNFETDASVAVLAASPATLFTNTPDSGAGMIGNRTLTVNKTVGGGGGANGAYADIIGGLLAMANGPVTNSIVTVDWIFGSTDLTEGGTKTGFFLGLPNPIDNDLNISISINGGTASSKLFPDGSSGTDFFFPFLDFVNGGDAATATTVRLQFSSTVAWDAEVDFIETIGPPPEVSEPASLALFGISMAGLGWARRRRVTG